MKGTTSTSIQQRITPPQLPQTRQELDDALTRMDRLCSRLVQVSPARNASPSIPLTLRTGNKRVASENPATDSPRRPARTGIARSPSTARISITLAVIIFVAACLAACTCPGFFVLMGACAALACWAGSRMQRMIATALFVIAIAGAVSQFREEVRERKMHQDRIRRINEVRKDPNRSK
jgi:lysylphosphatidylglycerol synthetase-like protein (DUF2156 family)